MSCSKAVTPPGLPDGAGTGRHDEKLGISQPSPFSREERGATPGVGDWSNLHKTPNSTGLESFCLLDMCGRWEGSAPPHTLPCVFRISSGPDGHLSFIMSFHNKPGIYWDECFCKSCELFWQTH